MEYIIGIVLLTIGVLVYFIYKDQKKDIEPIDLPCKDGIARYVVLECELCPNKLDASNCKKCNGKGFHQVKR